MTHEQQTVEIVSFGYLHGTQPDAHITIDLRNHFRDPHISPELRQLTANEVAVRVAVLRTPGIQALIEALVQVTVSYGQNSTAPLRIAIGCAGGRHRAPVVAAELHRRLAMGNTATVTHRDLNKPEVDR